VKIHTPLNDPDRPPPEPSPLGVELRLARDVLTTEGSANVHSNAAMIKAAAALHYRLSALIAALDAERGTP
jgi:hypothetical protein